MPGLSDSAALNSIVDRLLAGVGLTAGAANVGRTQVSGADPTVSSSIASAPAAAALIATTGALPVGAYRVEVGLGFSGVAAAGKHLLLEHRDATDAATLHTLALCPAGTTGYYSSERVNLLANQRLRVIGGAVAGAVGEVAQGSIRAQLLPS